MTRDESTKEEEDARSGTAPGGNLAVLARNVLQNFGSQVFVSVVGLVALPALTRLLSVSDFAYFSFLMLFTTSVVILEGLRPPFIQLLHDYRGKGQLRAFLNIAAGVNFAFALFMAAFAFLVFLRVGPEQAGWGDSAAIGGAVLFYFWGSLPSAVVAAEQKIGVVQFARSSAVAAMYLCFVVLAVADLGADHFPLAVLVANLSLFVCYRLMASRHLEDVPLVAFNTGGKLDPRDVLRQCSHGMVMGAANTVMHFADRLMIYFLLPSAAYATYSLGYEVGSRLNALPLMVGYPMFTLLSEKLSSEPADVLELYESVGKVILVLMAGLAASAIYWSDLVIGLFGGATYGDAVVPFRVIVLSTLSTSVMVVGYSFLHAVGDFRTQWQFTMLGGIVTLASSFWFVPQYGILGGGLALLAGRSVADTGVIVVAKWRASGVESGREAGVELRLVRWLVMTTLFCAWAFEPLSGGVVEFVVLLISGGLTAAWLMFDARDRRRAWGGVRQVVRRLA